MKRILGLLITLLSLPVFALTEHEQQEIVLASQAAPSNITEHASFMMFRDGGFVLLKEGKNNFTCLVVRNPQGRFEPSCFNTEARNSVLYTYELEMKLLYEGMSPEGVLSVINNHFLEGTLPTAITGSLVYMMSPNNKFYNYSTKTLGTTPIHQMYYYPKLPDQTFSLPTGRVMLWQGYPHLSALIIMLSP